MFCGSFGLCANYAAGILNSVEEIHFYVLCSEKLNYAGYSEKCIAHKKVNLKLLTEHNFKLVTEHFQLRFAGETVIISFEGR